MKLRVDLDWRGGVGDRVVRVCARVSTFGCCY